MIEKNITLKMPWIYFDFIKHSIGNNDSIGVLKIEEIKEEGGDLDEYN